MATVTHLQEYPNSFHVPKVKPLDEGLWRAWVAKGKERDMRSNAARTTLITWTPIFVLLGASLLGSDSSLIQILVRFIVVISAATIMFQSIHARRYAVAAALAGLVAVYNPVVPAFNLSGEWERIVVAASGFPFAAALAQSASGGQHNA